MLNAPYRVCRTLILNGRSVGKVTERLDIVYKEANIADKQKLNGLIFKGKMYFAVNRVRTTDLNEVVKLVYNNNKAFGMAKKRTTLKNQRHSGQVAPRGIPACRRSGCRTAGREPLFKV
jgi:hypothetical protein